MQLSPIQILIIIFMVTLGTMITRFLPFLLFQTQGVKPLIFNTWVAYYLMRLPAFLSYIA